MSPDVLAVQLLRQSFGAAEDDLPVTNTYRTFLLDPEDGRVLGAFSSDHQVIGGGSGRAVLYRSEPYPRVSVVEVS